MQGQMRRRYPRLAILIALILAAIGFVTWVVTTADALNKAAVWLHLVKPEPVYILVYERTLSFDVSQNLDRASSTALSNAANDLNGGNKLRAIVVAPPLSEQIAKAGGKQVGADAAKDDYRIKAIVLGLSKAGISCDTVAITCEGLQVEYQNPPGVFPRPTIVQLQVKRLVSD